MELHAEGVLGETMEDERKGIDTVDLRAPSEERFTDVVSDIDERKRAERLRMRLEAKFGAVFRATRDAYFLTSVPDGRIIEVNTAAIRLAGREAEEMLGRTTTELDLWADPAAREQYMERVRRDGGVRDFETQFRGKSGALIDGLISGEIIQLEEGPCFLSVVREVTEGKQVQSRLSASEALLRSIMDNIQDAYFRADLSGRFTMVSPSAARMYRYESIDEMLGLPAEALYADPQARASIVEEMRRAGRVDDHVGLGRRKDGTTFWVSMNAQLCRDASGNVVGTEGFVRDITERKLAEEALRESEARFRHVFQCIPNVAVQGYGPDGTTRYWNEASERLYGYTAQEAIGRNLVDLIIPMEMRAEVEQAIEQMAKTGQQIPASEVSLMRKDGSRVSVFSSHATVRKPGQATELYCLDIDITERKLVEGLLAKKLDELERFNRSMVGRELRMVELKREINELLASAGQPPKYRIHE